MPQSWACIDGNEAAARVAHALSDVIAIYPITPATPMGELADAWSAAGQPNLWGSVPEIVEMQSEGGAAGALHGALQAGALATTFTASQGLLLMVPNMFKIAGELTPAVIHVAARTVATHALSIFGDHSDVMAVRSTGWAMLASASVQEAHDFALVSHAASLRTRVPFLHFFDGWRTSHEINKIRLLDHDDLRGLVREADVVAHHARRMTPDHPVLRGSAQNPDVYFQAREAVNPFYEAVPGVVAGLMRELERRTGRRYGLVEYCGHPQAERVAVIMGSGSGAATESVEELVSRGERVGLLTVRLFRPFPTAELVRALPETVTAVAVFDRTKEPGAPGEPLYLDVAAALTEERRLLDTLVGVRYGLSSKELTPGMVKGVFDELREPSGRRHMTVGIVDDVTHLSVAPDPEFSVPTRAVQAVFFGLGSDGTVGANKASAKIIGEGTESHVQGYFVYDSRKAGAVTVSHLRFGPDPIRSTYLVENADFVACHHFGLLDKMKVLDVARPGATFLLNAPYPPDQVWAHLPARVQREIIEKRLRLFVIDADALARDAGLGGRINTVMQTCFFHLSGVLAPEEVGPRIRQAIEDAYGRRGSAVVERNLAAVDRALSSLVEVIELTPVPGEGAQPAMPDGAEVPEFVERVTARLLAGEGDLLPVSALPPGGTFPTGTARYEKRAIALDLPVWDPDLCIDCGKCAVVCPHTAVRMKVYKPAELEGAPDGFLSKPFRSHDLPGHMLSVQVAPDDCTGCGVCADVCPAHSKSEVRHKSLDMAPAAGRREIERTHWDFFLSIPEIGRDLVRHDTVKGVSVLEPLFEFSGACAGCGETPYLKLLTQLFGDRMIVANATGCSSIYGGNLPTTPWTVNGEGRGPTWANSLFEDNAEFGLGLRIGWERQHDQARRLVGDLRDLIGAQLADELLGADQSSEAGVVSQRERVGRLKEVLAGNLDGSSPAAERLLSLSDELVEKVVWVVGGDGWAYDIGFGGLDHVLSCGRNLNLLVLDTEVYSNTGGQASKATPRAAVAKFATSGKATAKKDLGAVARGYGDVYVAEIALGAMDQQSIRAMSEAVAWPGPSLVIAYSTCIAHGIEMSTSMGQQKAAVASGYWPLYRYHPSPEPGTRPFQLDSKAPTIPVRDFALGELRFSMLARSDPDRSRHLLALAQSDVDERWQYYLQLAAETRSVPHESPDSTGDAPESRARGGGSGEDGQVEDQLDPGGF